VHARQHADHPRHGDRCVTRTSLRMINQQRVRFSATFAGGKFEVGALTPRTPSGLRSGQPIVGRRHRRQVEKQKIFFWPSMNLALVELIAGRRHDLGAGSGNMCEPQQRRRQRHVACVSFLKYLAKVIAEHVGSDRPAARRSGADLSAIAAKRDNGTEKARSRRLL